MVEQETPKKQDNLVNSQENRKSCLYVTLADNSLPQSATEGLLKIGLSIIECTDIHTAQKLCEEKAYGLILLEECEDKDFFIKIKSSGSVNEQTPVVLLFSDALSDIAKDLVKDQFIDDVIFKCTTFDTDLAKAVRRLIDEPLHFAVTPKSKKSDTKKSEGSTPKRPKLDKTPISARKHILDLPTNHAIQQHSGWPVPVDHMTVPFQPLMMPPQGYGDPTYTNMDMCPAMYAQPAQTYPAVQPGMANGQPWMPALHQYFPDYVPDYQPHPSVVGSHGNSMGMLTAAVEMSLAVDKIQNSVPSVTGPTANDATTLEGDGSVLEGDQEATCPAQERQVQVANATATYHNQESLDNPDTAQIAPSNDQMPAQNVPVTQTSLDPTVAAPPMNYQESQGEDMDSKITLNGARQLLDNALQGTDSRAAEYNCQVTAAVAKSLVPVAIRNSDGVDAKESMVTPNRMPKRKRTSLLVKDDDSPLRTPTTAAERKGIHLEKERRRRERIARCWYMLRDMIPACSETADKATVFEMTVAYVHHCWKHHAGLIRKINKDFQQLCSVTTPPDDLDAMESMVESLLKIEKP